MRASSLLFTKLRTGDIILKRGDYKSSPPFHVRVTTGRQKLKGKTEET